MTDYQGLSDRLDSVASGQVTRRGVGSGIVLLLVVVALLCGVTSGLLLGGAAGFIAGRASDQEVSIPDALKQAAQGTPIARPKQATPAANPTAALASPPTPEEGSEQSATERRQPYIGVLVENVPAGVQEGEAGTPAADKGGIIVRRVEVDSPADRAGIQEGDRILAVDDQPIDNVEQLRDAVQTAGVGATIVLRIERKGEELELPVTIGSREQPAASQPGLPDLRVLPWDPDDPDLRRLLELLPAELRQQLEEALKSGRWPPTPARPSPGDA